MGKNVAKDLKLNKVYLLESDLIILDNNVKAQSAVWPVALSLFLPLWLEVTILRPGKYNKSLCGYIGKKEIPLQLQHYVGFIDSLNYIFMKHFFSIIFMAVIAIVSCNAQILWEVSGNGLSKPSYIMGTHHIASISIIDSIDGFNEAINRCDVLYGEVSKEEMNSLETQQKAMQLSIAPADSTLDKIFTPAQFDSIDNVLKKYTAGMASLQQLVMLKPTLVATQLAVMQSLKAFPDFNPQQQLDSHVQSLADSLGKELGAFETVDFQLNLLYGQPIAEQAKELLIAVRHDDELESFSHKLANAYKSQNLDLMYEYMNDPILGFDDASKKRLVDDRNQRWVETLVELMPQKSIFVCVGAGHLPGESGLLNLLRQKGYTVSPVK